MDKDRYGKCRWRSGFAVLSVLVVVAIIMVLYFLNMSALFRPVVKKNYSGDESRPWLSEELILGDESVIKMPKGPKVSLDEAVSLRGEVTLNGSERGIVTLDFNEYGEVGGQWRCAYSHERRDYSIEAEFAGNIDVKKTYSDKGGEDESLLYFIAKGDYFKKTFKGQGQDGEIEKGLVYVTGWLGKGYSAEGLVTITTDKKWSVGYEFECERIGE